MKTVGYAQKESSLKGSRSSKKMGESDILFNVWKAVEDMSYYILVCPCSGSSVVMLYTRSRSWLDNPKSHIFQRDVAK